MACPPVIAVGVPTFGVTTIVFVEAAVTVPLQLTALTETVAVPLYVLLQFMVAEVPVAVG